MSNTADEREKMYIIASIVIHPTALVTPYFEDMVSFIKETKGEAYESRVDKLKDVKGFFPAWNWVLQIIHSLESLHSDKEYDATFISKERIEKLDKDIEQRWSER